MCPNCDSGRSPSAKVRSDGIKRRTSRRRWSHKTLRCEPLEPRLALSHCGPYDLGDGHGPKFIGALLNTYTEDFSDNPNHEDPAAAAPGVDACEAQGERLFTYLGNVSFFEAGDEVSRPGNHGPIYTSAPPPGHLARVESPFTIEFRGIHPEYEVAAVTFDMWSDFSSIEFVGSGGSLHRDQRFPLSYESFTAARGTPLAGNRELGGIQAVRFTGQAGQPIYLDNVTIAIAPIEIDDPPRAFDDSIAMLPNRPGNVGFAVIDVLANDVDPEEGPLTIVSVTTPTNGTATIESNAIRYSPFPANGPADPGPDGPAFHGSDTFDYRIRDEGGQTSVGTVLVLVNTPPVVGGVLDYLLPHDDLAAPLIVPAAEGVLVNAFDDDDDLVITAELLQPPQHGSVVINPDGSFTYTRTDFSLPLLGDTFTFRPFDGLQHGVPKLVGITANRHPSVGGLDLRGQLPHSDLFSGVSRQLSCSDPDGDPIADVQVVSGPSNGTVAFQTSPSCSFEYHIGFGDFTENHTIEDSFTYEVVDALGGVSSRATVLLSFLNVEPVAVNNVAVDDNSSANDLSHFAFNRHPGSNNRYIVSSPGVLGNDFDVDGDPLYFHSVVTPPTQGTLTVDFSDGGFVYEPFDLLNDVNDSFAYMATDGFSTSNVATAHIFILRNLPPTSGELRYRTLAGSALIVDAVAGLLHDAEDAEGDPFDLFLLSAPLFGTLDYSEDGAFTYTPDPGFVGNDVMEFGLDGVGGFRRYPVWMSVFTPDDLDADGVDDAEEAAAIIAFDGNNSRVPDFTDPSNPDASNAVALFSPVNGQPLTLTSFQDSDFSNVALVSSPPAAPLPAGYSFPFGFLSFSIIKDPTDTFTFSEVSLSLPDGVYVDSYWKHGSTSANTSPHWYDFTTEVLSGIGARVIIDDDTDPDTDRIRLVFQDGKLGDGDLTVNGIIVDPGGPALVAAFLGGDYNANGRVEQADLDLVLLNWGRDAVSPPSGWLSDFPAGRIDQDELDAVLLNWGASAAALAAPVPAALYSSDPPPRAPVFATAFDADRLGAHPREASAANRIRLDVLDKALSDLRS